MCLTELCSLPKRQACQAMPACRVAFCLRRFVADERPLPSSASRSKTGAIHTLNALVKIILSKNVEFLAIAIGGVHPYAFERAGCSSAGSSTLEGKEAMQQIKLKIRAENLKIEIS